jgi:hypothetical protein
MTVAVAALAITPQRLMEPKRLSPGFNDVLQRCLSTRGTMVLRVETGGIIVESDSTDSAAVALTGRWRSPLLAGAHSSAAALLLLPFVFLIDGIRLPHDQICTLGRDDRTVADFFMRNLFYAACRNEPFTLLGHPTGVQPTITKTARDLARTFGWIAKALLKDDVFDSPNAPEYILASAHLPLTAFSTPLLRAGAAVLQRAAAENNAQAGGRRTLPELTQLREQILKLYV